MCAVLGGLGAGVRWGAGGSEGVDAGRARGTYMAPSLQSY